MSQLSFATLFHSEFWRKNDFLIDTERALPFRGKRYLEAVGEHLKQVILMYWIYLLNIHMEIFKINFFLHQNLQMRYSYTFNRTEMQKKD